MSGADTAPSMIYTCLHLYVLTSLHFGRNSRNHSRTVLEHTVLWYDIHILKVISSTSVWFVQEFSLV